MKNIVSIIIITYHPNVEMLEKNVSNLLLSPLTNNVIIVDNGSSVTFDNLSKLSGVIVEYLGGNRGIATAQNIGLRMAQSNHSAFALLLDQDSEIESDLVEKLVDGFNEVSSKGYRLAAVGPRPFDLFEKKKMKPLIQRDIAINDSFSLTKQIIASGKLIKMDVLKDVGMMDDDLFIDGVDHEWCWRAGQHGYKIAIIESAIMKHRLGDARGTFLGMTYKIGSPIRLYYQFRNILILSRRTYVPLYWKIRCFIGMFLRFVIFSIKEDDSKIRRHYMMKGIKAGLKKEKGIID